MNRTIIPLAATVSALTPLLFDSALKGAVLLMVAALGALVLWRASAATRHLVWLVSVVALLMVPVLSVALPQWRVLPGWAAVVEETEGRHGSPAAAAPSPLPEPADAAAAVPEASAIPEDLPQPWETTTAAAPSVPRVPVVATRGTWLGPAWATGFTLLALRLLAAHLLLRRATRQCRVVAVRPPSGDPDGIGGEERMAATLSAACGQLGIRQRVTLLVDEARTIPVVWGVLCPHLLLPAEARGWGDEQLRAVVLHELAHIRRRDTLVQWLTQIACALHWWNPLVWLAAWRLHVERERACDDLVLASGVRPSAYAEHLLHVATRFSPARWTSACGLAMARKSSLEGRLMAVLSDRLNRRGVTTALAAVALLLAAGIAVPVAMLRAAEPEKSTTEAPAVNAQPKDTNSRPLFDTWKAGARSDGRIPGGCISEMAASLKAFMELNPGHEQSVRLEPVVKKCDASRDWTPAEAAALLDEIAVITPRAEWVMRAKAEREIHPGKPLPDELANAPWGRPAENGLRTAWLLEPRAETQALDSVMKSRVLFHNAGKAPVCFATENWIQTGGHQAKDANGKAISIWAVERMGLRLRMVFRLAPGEYAEVEGHGLGLGSHETSSEKSIDKVGCWIEAKEGDAVTFTPGKLPVSFATWMEPEGRKDSITVWQEMMAKRVALESPMPAAAADREQLLRRALLDLLGTAPTPEELAAFVADDAPEALAKLTARLQARAGAMHFAGELSGGATRFRVTAAQPKEDSERAKQQSQAPAVKPKHEYAQSLFKKWQANARTDGKIPGGLIGQIAREVEGFIKRYPDDESTPKLAALRPRLDTTHDWTQAEVVALFDDITAISTAPVSWADIPMAFSSMRAIHGGQPLPIELKSAAWGQPAANGLRAAWLLEPRAEQYALGSVLKARVLFQNLGKEPVVFRTETWHQDDPHTARDAKGVAIKVNSTWYTGITPMATFRLDPYEYCEVKGHGIAIGGGEYKEEHSLGSVGAVIEAKEGDVVSFSSTVDASHGDWTRPDDPKDPAELWKRIVRERVEREAPLPGAAADRAQLIRRVTLDLLGIVPTAEEVAAFTVDNAPDALAKLVERLLAKNRLEPFAGKLPTGATTFRVIPADPEAAKAPRTANAPGRYVLGDSAHLLVSRTTEGDRHANKATIAFLSPDPKVASPHKRHEIALPDGLGTYGLVWDRGTGALWVMQKSLVRKYEFTNPSQVQEVRYDHGSIVNIPAHLQEPMRKLFDRPDAPGRQHQESQQPGRGARLQPGTEEKLEWGEPVNGLRMALAWPPTLGEPAVGEVPDFFLAVQNVSAAPVRLCTTTEAPNQRRLTFSTAGVIQFRTVSSEPNGADATLGPREVVFLRLFTEEAKEPEKVPHGSMLASAVRQGPAVRLLADMEITTAPPGAWTGKLATPWTRAGIGAEAPKNRKAQELFKVWLQQARVNGKIPGGHVARLGDKVKEFVRANTGDKSGDPFAKKMEPLVSRLDGARDWQPAEASALLNDIAAVSDAPLSVRLEETAGGTIQNCTDLPPELENAPWGKALPNGLRVACLLEPRGAEHRLGTPLRMRLLVHNAGKEPVVVRTRTWHHLEPTARDAKGAEITMESVTRYTRAPLVAYRLVPGRFVELASPGLGIGRYGFHDFKDADVATWIGVTESGEVTLTPGPVPLSDWNEAPVLDGEPRWWLDFIAARLSLANPLPADAAERTQLLESTVRDLFQSAATAEETAAFVADRELNPLESLAKRLARRPGLNAWAGSLTSGPTTVRVTLADPGGSKPAPAPPPASPAPAEKPK